MFVGMVASAGWREAARTEHLRGENTMRLKLVLLGGIADATRALKSPLGARIAYVALVLCTLLAGIVAVLVA